ncbi:MAG: ketoacyl-ACP synthase III [Holophaga sp.]|nr:ketoacyl-ACP synthase III [Holophaga sp.]
MKAVIRGIACHFPEQELTTEQLAAENPSWQVEKIQGKIGIHTRHIAAPDECASDLGVAACRKLFATGVCQPQDIDFLLFCTQSPDHFLPTTACLVQDRLGLPTHAGALDFNLGCSGYVYGLGLAKGLVETGQARNVLLVTAETYSKHVHPGDRSVRILFGDAAAATLVSAGDGGGIGPMAYGTDGRGGANLIVPSGGMRQPRTAETGIAQTDKKGNTRSADHLFMDGPKVFTFTQKAVPALVDRLMAEGGFTMESVDYFVFHQANEYMLESLRRRIGIPKAKFLSAFAHCGNTVSASIPIVLQEKVAQGVIRPGHRVVLVGFGVGYSLGATLVEWA